MKTICTADGNKIYSVAVTMEYNLFYVDWESEIGVGSFSFKIDPINGGYILDTEFMGRKFCLDIIEYLFSKAEVEYDD